MDDIGRRRVAVVAGARTPFVKAGTAFKGPLELARRPVSGLVERYNVDPNPGARLRGLRAGALERELVLEPAGMGMVHSKFQQPLPRRVPCIVSW